ncbi:MAG TPA: hypothetical protein VG248_10975 [Caulobacteraceae bacterium]|jgi:hypothetical protein|nr:hypothetical protein [Caulobacteraceae bacterium]
MFQGGIGNLNEGLSYDSAGGIITRTRDNTSFCFGGYPLELFS